MEELDFYRKLRIKIIDWIDTETGKKINGQII
jgi:hypothetical protein